MPPSSSEQPISRSAQPCGDQPAGRGRAGEADVVGAADHLGPDLASPGRRPRPQVRREAGLLEQLGAEQRGEHGLRVRLGDHGVAGQQRRQPVAERHRERVVPGRDDPDDALGDAVDLDPGQAGDDAELALGVEVLVRRAARSSGRSARRAAARRTRACGPCRTPSTIRSMISSWRSRIRSCSRSRIAARSSRLTRLHACCALRARANACATSSALDCGMCASGAPFSGLRTSTVCPVVASDPPGQALGVLRLEGVRRRGVVLGIARPLDQRTAGGARVPVAHPRA